MQINRVRSSSLTETARPASATGAIVLMLALGVVWIFIGLAIATDLHPAMHISAPWRQLFAGLFMAGGMASLVLGILLSRPRRRAYYAALLFLVASTVAVIFDQIGWVDLIFVAVNITPVILLLHARHWYLKP